MHQVALARSCRLRSYPPSEPAPRARARAGGAAAPRAAESVSQNAKPACMASAASELETDAGDEFFECEQVPPSDDAGGSGGDASSTSSSAAALNCAHAAAACSAPPPAADAAAGADPPFLPTTPATDALLAELRAAAPSGAPLDALERCVRRCAEERVRLAAVELARARDTLRARQADVHAPRAERAQANECLKWLARLPIAVAIDATEARLRELGAALQSDAGWTLVHDSDGIATYYKQDAGSAHVSMKVRAVMDSPVLDLVTLISEIDLLPTFITFVPLTVVLLKEASDFCKTLQVAVDMPWPLSGRDVVIDGRGVDLLDDELGAIAIMMRELHADTYADLAVPEPPRGYVRMGVQQCGAMIRPLTSELTYLEAIFSVDPKLAVVPDWLINFFTKKLTHMGVSLFRTQCRNIPCSQFEDRQRAKPRLYADVRARVERFFGARHAQRDAWPAGAEVLARALPKRDAVAEARALEQRRRAMEERRQGAAPS